MKTGQSYQYTRMVGKALAAYRPWLYDGREGALRLAREYGAGLADGPDAEARELMNNGVSYNEICVKGYGLKPPLSVKEWQEEVRRSYESVLDGDFEGGDGTMKQLCPSCGDEFEDGGYGFVECEGCREVDLPDESEVYGNDCPSGKCEV